MKNQKEEIEELTDKIGDLERDLNGVRNERDRITASLQLALTQADSEQLVRKIAEDQVHAHPLTLVNSGDCRWLSPSPTAD